MEKILNLKGYLNDRDPPPQRQFLLTIRLRRSNNPTTNGKIQLKTGNLTGLCLSYQLQISGAKSLLSWRTPRDARNDQVAIISQLTRTLVVENQGC